MRIFAAIVALCAALPLPALAQGAGALDVVRSIRASWYDCKAKGQCSASKRTANGEQFNPNAMTCAHRTAPFGTHFRIRHKGRYATCRVNDRGPFIRGRDLDMARAVARALGIFGVAVVTIERM